MKAMVCEMCGSNDLVKQDGMYVCQSCNTKYSIEEARKLFVQIDNSAKLDNYYQLARRARDNNNTADAEKYYDIIRQEDANSWEANFYAVYYHASNCKIAEIGSAALSISNCIHSTFELIKNNIIEKDERIKAVAEICNSSYIISQLLENAAESHYNGIDSSIRSRYSTEYWNNQHKAQDIRKTVCDELCNVFGDDEAVFTSVGFKYVKDRAEQIFEPAKYLKVIHRFDPTFTVTDKTAEKEKALKELDDLQNQINQMAKQQTKSSSGGCYVATAVYGSYDCPQVWILRRYRDYTLARTWYGRTFIRVYYAISPKMVQWFGESDWFKNLCKPLLDRKVKCLKQKGIADTKYID